MTNIRKIDQIAPLDMSGLDLGPPIEDEGASRALVRRYELGHPNPRDVMSHPDAQNIDAENETTSGIRIRHKGQPNVRHMTPRQIQRYGESLYAAGILGFEDYEDLAFQPDLHPQFNRTIGALTGERADPERPRDYVIHWQERLNFARRYHTADAEEVRKARRILQALKTFPQEADVLGHY